MGETTAAASLVMSVALRCVGGRQGVERRTDGVKLMKTEKGRQVACK